MTSEAQIWCGNVLFNDIINRKNQNIFFDFFEDFQLKKLFFFENHQKKTRFDDDVTHKSSETSKRSTYALFNRVFRDLRENSP